MRITFTGPGYDYYTADLTGAELEVLVKICSKAKRMTSYPRDSRIILHPDDSRLDLQIAIVSNTPVMTKEAADEEDVKAEAAKIIAAE